ncbi:MAG: TolC family protein [Candidatus Melainabacteria bacterium]|jgi:outer membrane protein|nr:MAG: TolC family protein [Candidatus Melainabacteria bacterium]
MRRLSLALSFLLMVFSHSPTQAQDAPFSEPQATTEQEVGVNNPIKLTISATALGSDLPTVTGPLTMDQAVQSGLKNNLDNKQSLLDTEISRLNSRAALARFGPNISLSTFYSTSSLNQMLFYPNDGVVASAPMQPIVRGSSFSTIVAGVQPLFTGGYLRGNYRAAKSSERQSLAKYQQSRIDIARTIKQAYLQCVWNRARLQVDTDYVKFRTLSTSNMHQRMVDGKAPRADFLREEAELAQAKAQVNRDYRDFNVSIINLKAAMGANLSSLIDVTEGLNYAQNQKDLNGYLNAAGTNRPEIRQAQSKVEEMKARKLIARSQYLPHVDLYGLGSNITGTSPDGTAEGKFGGFVSVIGHYTLYDSGQRSAQLHSAHKAITQSGYALQQTRLKVAQEVSTAWVDLDLSARNVDLAKSQVVSAEEDFRLIKTRYNIGKSTALEQFDAAVKLYRARLALTESIYNYRLAQTQIVWASGDI